MNRITRRGLALLLAVALALCLSPLAAAAPAADGVVHTVQPGDNLFRIGLKYGVSWSAIMQANGLASTYIYTGQQLIIPTGDPAGPPPSISYEIPVSYTVAYGDTLAIVAQRYGLTVAALAGANGLSPQNWLYAGQTITVPGAAAPPARPQDPAPALEPATAGGAYVVQPGDTLSSIAQRYGVTTATLAAANGLAVSSWVYTGQAITLPGDAAAAPAQAAPALPTSGGGKEILVDISAQRLYAYQNGALVYDFVASTGLAGLDTAPGSYSVLNKIPNAYGATWNIWMPNWLGIYWAGSLQNGIHALPILPGGGRLWDGWLGTPVSYGCVILGVWEAQTLYDWAEVGTPVIIQR